MWSWGDDRGIGYERMKIKTREEAALQIIIEGRESLDIAALFDSVQFDCFLAEMIIYKEDSRQRFGQCRGQ